MATSDTTGTSAATAEAMKPAAARSFAEALAGSPERLLHDWRSAHARCLEYLEDLGIPEDTAQDIAQQAISEAVTRDGWEAGADSYSEALRSMREIVLQRFPAPDSALRRDLEPFTAWRHDVAANDHLGGATKPDPARQAVAATPPIVRGSMPHATLSRRFRRPLAGPLAEEEAAHAAEPPEAPGKPGAPARKLRRELPWTKRALRRRLVLGSCVWIPSLIASKFMMDVLPQKGDSVMEMLIVGFFGLLFGWISIGFWTALFGFYTLLRKEDRFKITHLNPGESFDPIGPEARTAIVMPICEEPVERIFAGLRAIQESLDRAGGLDRFDFFIMSDSGDAATGVREEEAWLAWCKETNGFGRIFYRRRKVRLKRKSGNVADFCRRWGRSYRYMIMLDADSVMAGEALVRLVQLMEKHPGAGMIQTAPTAVYRRSIFGRVQQFSGRVYGPMFTAGLHYWQLGDGQYWGHNTIIRVAPFMEHCGLPPLSGKPPLGGDILSHDFVEAALMGRAGWSLWLAFDLPGSFEETPSSLLEEMKRDRRWCQGNLQHVRLLFTEGLFGAHRALFLNGALSYVSALLWFSFLLLSTAEAIRFALSEPVYFPAERTLFPEWPVWKPDQAISLLIATCIVLFLPKLLSVALILFRGRAQMFGGALRLLLSVPLETILSSLFAPIRMVFHTRFVITNLLGRTVGWKSQPREDAETTWREAITHHGADTIFACAWAAMLLLLSPDYFWWLMPVVGALILSIPTSVLVSKIGLGDRARRFGLFVIPEETEPPREILEVESFQQAAGARIAALPAAWRDGFAMAVADPRMNAVHRALLGPPRRLKASIREARRALLDPIVTGGPETADAKTRKVILSDPDLVEEIHWRVWRSDDEAVVRRWGVGV